MKNNKDILKNSTFVFLISSGLSVFSIFWIYRDLLNMDNTRVVENFPYIKIGIIISLISCLTGTIYSLIRKLNEIENKQNTTFNSGMIVVHVFTCFAILTLLYPGLNNLKIRTDFKMVDYLLCVTVIQSFTIYILSYQQDYKSISYKKYLFFFIICLCIIFLLPLVSKEEFI